MQQGKRRQGRRMSEQARLKISEAQKLRWQDPLLRESVSAKQKARPRSLLLQEVFGAQKPLANQNLASITGPGAMEQGKEAERGDATTDERSQA